MSLSEQFLKHQENTDSWPAILGVLAGSLGVSLSSLQALGIGWSIQKNAWAVPERNSIGEITGLVYRHHDGRQWCETGSKRGLTYVVQSVTPAAQLDQTYNPTKQTWTRATSTDPCPICNHEKWCSFDGDHTPPEFIRCMRNSEGAIYHDRDGGHIHELVPGGFKPLRKTSALEQSELPILIVEGMSDVAAAFDLGYQAVGRPCAGGKLTATFTQELARLVTGRDVAIIGENDSGAGVEGMKAAFYALRGVARSVVKILPPTGIKDLREWKKLGVTQKQLQTAISQGDTTTDPNILEDVNPLPLAKRWLQDTRTEDGFRTLQYWLKDWYMFDGVSYKPVADHNLLKHELYCFCDGKQYLKGSPKGPTLESYAPTKAKIEAIIDALLHLRPVYDNPPVWLTKKEDRTAATHVLIFRNGRLDLLRHLAGKPNAFEPNAADLFALAAIPYDFVTKADCPRWRKFLEEVFPARPRAQAVNRTVPRRRCRI